jgi:thiol-disulfide isomerase/thioredoxin
MKQACRGFFLSFSALIYSNFLFAQQNSNASFNSSAISSFKLTHATQTKIDTTNITLSKKPLQLFIFLSPECPLSKNYTLTLNKLFQQYNNQVEFYGCVSGKGFNIDEIQSFINTYKIPFPLFIDESKKLTNYLTATITPEVILLNNQGEIIYCGAIDDWMEGLGKQKINVSKHYLQDAITSSLNNKEVVVKKTKAYGCLINDY